MHEEQIQPGWVSLEDVARYWSISTDSARRALADMSAQKRKVGRLVRYRYVDMVNLGRDPHTQPVDNL